MDPVRVGMLFFILYFFLVVTLVVAGLALRHVRKIASLTEERIRGLREAQERVQSFYQEEHTRLEGELEQERQKLSEAQKNLEQERQQRLEALQQAEGAKQEAMREATLQLREWMDHDLAKLNEDGQHRS
jgi:biopolymer transport protein ExbB/TolQ